MDIHRHKSGLNKTKQNLYSVYIHECTYIFSWACTHMNIFKEHIQKISIEKEGLHGQLTPMGHSQTQILGLKKFTSYQNNLYYKNNNGNLTI